MEAAILLGSDIASLVERFVLAMTPYHKVWIALLQYRVGCIQKLGRRRAGLSVISDDEVKGKRL